MSSMTALVPRRLAAPAVEPEVRVEPGAVEVLGLDAAGTLGFVVERRRRQDVAAAEELRAVTHWADLHRVGYVGAADPEIATAVQRRATTLALTGQPELPLHPQQTGAALRAPDRNRRGTVEGSSTRGPNDPEIVGGGF